MSVPILTAAASAKWETDLAANFADSRYGIAVVRRCVDLAELLSTAASGIARVVLLAADLRGVNQDAITRLKASGVVVFCISDDLSDAQAQNRLQQLGIDVVLFSDIGAEQIALRIVQAVGGVPPAHLRRMVADPIADFPDFSSHTLTSQPEPGIGKVVAIWGPTGAPGRTTVAIGVADEAARLGIETLLVDADVYGGVIAALLGLLDESPGLAAAARHANNGVLDVARLAGLAWQVQPKLRVLTGIARADRWPELRPAAVETVLDKAKRLASLIVVDCGFSLEQDEEISFDTAAPRRNGATLSVLETADLVLCVGAADPVGLQRLIRGIDELRTHLPDVEPHVVINSVRSVVVPGDPQREISRALGRHAGINKATYLPRDNSAADFALGLGRTIAEVAPTSLLRHGLAGLARNVVNSLRITDPNIGPPPAGYSGPPNPPTNPPGPRPSPNPPGPGTPGPLPYQPTDPRLQPLPAAPGYPMPAGAPQNGHPVPSNEWFPNVPIDPARSRGKYPENRPPFTEFDQGKRFPPSP